MADPIMLDLRKLSFGGPAAIVTSMALILASTPPRRPRRPSSQAS
jgi:hypothetical protein